MTNIPTIGWNEGSPSGSQAKSLGALRIREWKEQIREILGVDHIFDSSGQDIDWGYHKQLSFYAQESDISTPPENTGAYYAKTVSGKPEWSWIDEDDNIMQLTSGNNFVGGMVGEVKSFWGALSDIPTGWELCDGGGDPARPNLIAQFISGVATDATDPGDTGGSNSITISEAQMKEHLHTSVTASGGSHQHTVGSILGVTQYLIDRTFENLYENTDSTNIRLDLFGSQTSASDAFAHTHTVTSNSSGSGTAYDNRPAYFEVAFIIKT